MFRTIEIRLTKSQCRGIEMLLRRHEGCVGESTQLVHRHINSLQRFPKNKYTLLNCLWLKWCKVIGNYHFVMWDVIISADDKQKSNRLQHGIFFVFSFRNVKMQKTFGPPQNNAFVQFVIVYRNILGCSCPRKPLLFLSIDTNITYFLRKSVNFKLDI